MNGARCFGNARSLAVGQSNLTRSAVHGQAYAAHCRRRRRRQGEKTVFANNEADGRCGFSSTGNIQTARDHPSARVPPPDPFAAPSRGQSTKRGFHENRRRHQFSDTGMVLTGRGRRELSAAERAALRHDIWHCLWRGAAPPSARAWMAPRWRKVDESRGAGEARDGAVPKAAPRLVAVLGAALVAVLGAALVAALDSARSSERGSRVGSVRSTSQVRWCDTSRSRVSSSTTSSFGAEREALPSTRRYRGQAASLELALAQSKSKTNSSFDLTGLSCEIPNLAVTSTYYPCFSMYMNLGGLLDHEGNVLVVRDTLLTCFVFSYV